MIRFLFALILIAGCAHKTAPDVATIAAKQQTQINKLQCGADRLDVLLPLLRNQSVALVVNHTAMVGTIHLADTLLASGIRIQKIMAPEHGFRGKADAGETVKDGVDTKTGLPIISLYGTNKKPTAVQLADVDVVIFDIQDVGVRFFTYISTLHYVMEACAENNKKLIVLDRPDPNSHYVDGPVLEEAHKSFVGMHPVPIIHGLTIGEYALMINGEQWIDKPCNVEVITMLGWKHGDAYSLPHKPSPNLPNDHAIQLYPSTCLFEGTVISVGRGTQNPFELIGHPAIKNMPFSFTPVSIDGMSKNPPFEKQICFGVDLRTTVVKPQLDLSYLIEFYQAYPDKEKFFISYFEKLSGTSALRKQIETNLSETEIRKSWEPGLQTYKEKRKKYLRYP